MGEQGASLARASRRIAWASKALNAAAADLYSLGVGRASEILAEEAARLDRLGEEVSELQQAGEPSAVTT